MVLESEMAASFCPYFPKEMLEIIFSWLPADSLIRFKRVNKFWYDLIRDLIKDKKKHLHNLSNNESSASLVFAPTTTVTPQSALDTEGCCSPHLVMIMKTAVLVPSLNFSTFHLLGVGGSIGRLFVIVMGSFVWLGIIAGM